MQGSQRQRELINSEELSRRILVWVEQEEFVMTNERIQQGGKPGWGCLQAAHTVTVLCKRMAVFKHNLDVWNLERLQQEAGTALPAQELD